MPEDVLISLVQITSIFSKPMVLVDGYCLSSNLGQLIIDFLSSLLTDTELRFYDIHRQLYID